MTIAHFVPMAYQQNTQQCIDPSDMDSFIDFGNMSSPNQGSSMGKGKGKMPAFTVHQAITSPTSTALPLDSEDQTPVAPSHDYGRFKQQTGLPTGAMAGLFQNQTVFSSFNSGIDEAAFGTFDGMGSQNAFGSMAGDMGLEPDLPAFFYPGQDTQNDSFVNPTAITKQEDDQANIRYYPGMHQQQANAMRAQQAAAQRQQMMAQQRAREQQAQQANSQRKASHAPTDPHAEETIARVVNQIRQNSMMHASMSPEQDNMLPHMIRSRKDEEDMDDDERLLNSEEGKKLSSKERRQLRNKVSARAFRSRRKEYIGQLEGEVAMKVNEANELKIQNRALMEENAKFRALAERLLGHAAFRPFLEELSRDPEIAQSLTVVGGGQSATPTPQPIKKDANPYDFNTAQQFSPNQTQHVGMTLVPETQIDFSQLNLGGNSWGMQMGGMPNGYQPQVFAVLEVPEEPIDVAVLSCKPTEQLESEPEDFATCKYDVPAAIEAPEVVKDMPASEERTATADAKVAASELDEHDPSFTLYATASIPALKPNLDDALELLSHLPSEKSSQYQLTTEATSVEMGVAFEKTCARLDAACHRLDAMMSRFNF